MSEFPPDWTRTTFGNVLKQRKEAGFTNEELLAVTSALGIVKRDSLERRDTSNEDKSKYLLVEEGDIAYNTMRMWQGVSGVSRFRGIVSPAYTICTPTEGIEKDFAGYLLKDPEMISIFRQRSQGLVSDTWNLKYESFAQIPCTIPPLPEQKKIAEILSGIDKRIKLARQRISQLEALIKSLGRNYFGTANQYGMKSIGELFEISSGTTPSRARQDYFCRKDGTPWVKTMDLNDNYIRNTDECLTDLGVQEGKARIFPKGTLLVAMYGGWNQIGRTGILAQNSSCNQAMSALLPTKEVLPEFLNLQLIIRRSYWKGVAASSRKDPNITKSDVAEMPIAIPPVEDQLEIAKTLGSVMNSCQKEDRYLDSLNLLKQSVASDLLSGRKRVSV
jgi:type I restriction enzyme S subunit